MFYAVLDTGTHANRVPLMQIAGHDHRSTLTEGSRMSYYFTHFEYQGGER